MNGNPQGLYTPGENPERVQSAERPSVQSQIAMLDQKIKALAKYNDVLTSQLERALKRIEMLEGK